MQQRTMTLLAGAALALAACGGTKANTTAAANTATPANDAMTDPGAATTTNGATGLASAWPEGARIIEEGGATYRVEAGGARVRLEPGDSRIVTENGVRYRVDRDGTRTRINAEGLRIGDSVIRGNAPNGRSDVETPGEAATDAVEDAAEAVGDIVDPPKGK